MSAAGDPGEADRSIDQCADRQRCSSLHAIMIARADRRRCAWPAIMADKGEAGQAAWRDPERYRRLAGIDRAGLMWEWLRRDPDYVAWFARASAVTLGAASSDPLPWGLHFRRGSDDRGARRAPHLACRPRSRCAGGRGDAGTLLGPRCDRSGGARQMAERGRRRRWPRTCCAQRWLAAYPAGRGGGHLVLGSRGPAVPPPRQCFGAVQIAAPAPSGRVLAASSIRAFALSARPAHRALAGGAAGA